MKLFWSAYLGDSGQGHHPYASPIRAASLVGLPDATIITAWHDPLRDEGRDYAAALSAAGVDAWHSEFLDQAHAFNELQGVLDAAQVAVDEAATRIVASFARVAASSL